MSKVVQALKKGKGIGHTISYDSFKNMEDDGRSLSSKGYWNTSKLLK